MKASWEATCVPQAPQWLRTNIDSSPEPTPQPSRAPAMLGMRPPAYRSSRDRDRAPPSPQRTAPPPQAVPSPGDQPLSSRLKGQTVSDPASNQSNEAADGPAVSSSRRSSESCQREKDKTPSILELVSQAAREAEIEQAAAAARRAAAGIPSSPRTPRSDKPGPPNQVAGSSSSSRSSSSRSSSSAALLIPRSPMSAKPVKPAAGQAEQQRRAAAVAAVCPLPRAASGPAAASGLVLSSSRASHSPQAAGQQPVSRTNSAFQPHSKQVLPLQHCSAGSECGSEDGQLHLASSLCSSSSSSSLCSAASCSSIASSTTSTGSRPKSILLTRTSTSSSCSTASSPRFSKRVTWKDGQADEECVGQELVAVRVMEDSPEMRRVRRDTWPERPGAKRDAADQAAAAAASLREQQQQQQPGPGLVVKLLSEPTRLLDWREKLKQLQHERRQQRMAQVRAGWQAQQQAQDSHSSGQDQQQLDQAAAVAVVEVMNSFKPCVSTVSSNSSSTIHITAVASSLQAATT